MNYNGDDGNQNLYDEDMTTDKKTYLLALEVEPMEVGRSYAQLPMHCTVMHRFLTELSAEALIAELAPIFDSADPLALRLSDHVAFGPRKQLVTLIESSPELVTLHNRLFDRLNSLSVRYTELDWVDAGYVPHVTDKNGKRISPKLASNINAAYLISIEHPLKGDKRSINYKFVIS